MTVCSQGCEKGHDQLFNAEGQSISYQSDFVSRSVLQAGQLCNYVLCHLLCRRLEFRLADPDSRPLKSNLSLIQHGGIGSVKVSYNQQADQWAWISISIRSKLSHLCADNILMSHINQDAIKIAQCTMSKSSTRN